MKNSYFSKSRTLLFSVLLFILPVISVVGQVTDVSITIHVRGVFETEISLLGQSGSRVFKSIKEIHGIRAGEVGHLLVSGNTLPGEFVLRFDYKEKESSNPYPSEKYIYINSQDLEIWVNPKYCNDEDSLWFQKHETENTALKGFSAENGKQKEKLGLLQNFLLNYDDSKSAFYREGIIEYENRRKAYNQWLADRIQQDRALFVSTLYRFEFVPQIPWTGTESDRLRSLIDHYFDGIDFSNPFIIRLSMLNKWMDNYVNLYGALSTSIALRDSLIPEAGRIAIEKVKSANPVVYGWMVDYFYKGFETNGINNGMKILEPYLNDPSCMTTKRLEIEKRLKGMEMLVPGVSAPDISLLDVDGNVFEINSLVFPGNYILLLFWSAGCSHCVELVDALYPWQQQPDIRNKIKVVAISLDETDSEIKTWKIKTATLTGWKNLNEPDGVRSKTASNYYILSTPVMILLDAKTKKVIALPNSLKELMDAVR